VEKERTQSKSVGTARQQMSQAGSGRKRQLSDSPTGTTTCNPIDDKRQCTTMSKEIKNFGDLKNFMENDYLNKVTEIIRVEVSPIQVLVTNVQISLSAVERKMDSLEREINKKKLRLVGIAEEKNETREQLKTKLETFIKGNLKIADAIEFDNFFRMGRPRDGVARPMMRLKDRFELLKAKKNLKGSKIYLDVMLTERGARVEKQLRDKGKELKKANGDIKFFIRNGTLTVDNKGAKTTFKSDGSGSIGEVQPGVSTKL
jgi:hypothetical protein